MTLLRGKYKGRKGHVLHQTERHHLSSKDRFAIRVIWGGEHRTLLVNTDGFN